jgi:hypothetical protein
VEEDISTSQGHLYGQFRRALERGNLMQASALARELPQVGLADALQLCLLIHDKQPDRFEPAALRWLGRLAFERPRLTLREAHLATAALRALPSPAAYAALRKPCA